MSINDWGAGANERLVLGKKDPLSWVGFQWSGNEPEGLYDTKQATALGAEWEGDELVVYGKDAFFHVFSRVRDGWMEDSD